jgi:hypothetical protein
VCDVVRGMPRATCDNTLRCAATVVVRAEACVRCRGAKHSGPTGGECRRGRNRERSRQ